MVARFALSRRRTCPHRLVGIKGKPLLSITYTIIYPFNLI